MEIFREQRKKELICRTLISCPNPGRFHWHENIEICQVKSPECSFIIDGNRIDAQKGDIVFVGEYVVHRFIINKYNTAIRLCQFPLNLLLDSGNVARPIKAHITKEELNSVEGLFEKIDFLFDMMEDENFCEKSSDNPYFSHLSASLYFLLMKYFPSEEKNTNFKKDKTEFYRITEYINNNFKEDIKITSISQKLCIPRARLSSIFMKYAEMSINMYINTLRINFANNLIENGKDITDAAYESGFQSIRTFNEVYKKIMHITPSEFKKNPDYEKKK